MSIREYVKEKNEMLLKCSVEELKKFVRKYKKFYSKEYLENFEKADDKLLEVTLHKLIANSFDLPENFIMKSVEWLEKNGFSPYIW